jgi:hypothetical protein
VEYQIIRAVRSLLSLYALLQLIHFALPFITNAQRPWMAVLTRICEPGIKVGNRVAAKLLPDRRYPVDVGPIACALLCWAARFILSFFI